MSESDDPGSASPQPEHHRSILERLRGTGVGTEDPNIIGDAGPTDVAPGADPPLPPLTEELPPEEETPSERLLPSDEERPVDDPDIVEVVEIVDELGGVEIVEVQVIEVVDLPTAEEPR